MNGKFCLFALILVLSLVLSSYVVLAQSYKSEEEKIAETIHIRKIMKIRARRSKSPPDSQWGGSESPEAPGPNAV
ncbi:hypothetical protein EUTSA_v10022359mg [Eutrema salsugineum]|uniref:Transmembrane protein n=1 Tax=Eutrema salsugineum TaxID=72664 RepID=V4LXU3_EUTSA|nr:uncharacterized protein LOC18025010 [Eutrema salsugineum]ESQ48674.1 hypothetical protein EUTSA_v10022359mg [Eutrema salsugineum]